MFRIPLLFAVALTIAFGGGIWSTIKALEATAGFGSIALGPWVAFPQAQTKAADPYARAHRAREGRLLMGGAEGLVFTAASDDSGAPLSAQCDYALTGTTPQARFWTLHTTGAAGQPPRAVGDLPTAFNAWSVLRAPDSSFAISVSPTAKPGNWLALEGKDGFRLVLTLLDTPTAGSSGVIDLVMPKITRIACSDA